MNLHKNTRVTPYARQEIGQLHQTGQCSKTTLAEGFNVSLPTIHNLINRARLQIFVTLTLNACRRLKASYPPHPPILICRHGCGINRSWFVMRIIDKWNWCALLTSIMPLNRIKDWTMLRPMKYSWLILIKHFLSTICKQCDEFLHVIVNNR